jgi:hypothetical protein
MNTEFTETTEGSFIPALRGSYDPHARIGNTEFTKPPIPPKVLILSVVSAVAAYSVFFTWHRGNAGS